jgi:phage shock protein C
MNWGIFSNHAAGRRPFWAVQGLRRDRDKGRVSGVCAGIARHWDIRVKWVRIAAVIALIFAPMMTVIAYAVATFLLKPFNAEPAAPTNRAGGKAAPYDLPPDLSFPALRRKFREIEERAGAMETEVTSHEFNLRRDFRRMGGM